jgi:hypothetical protein
MKYKRGTKSELDILRLKIHCFVAVHLQIIFIVPVRMVLYYGVSNKRTSSKLDHAVTLLSCIRDVFASKVARDDYPH